MDATLALAPAADREDGDRLGDAPWKSNLNGVSEVTHWLWPLRSAVSRGHRSVFGVIAQPLGIEVDPNRVDVSGRPARGS